MRHGLAVVSLALLVTACGGGGNTTPPPGPILSNLRGQFTVGCTASGRPGTTLVGLVDFTDIDGDLAGGVLQITGTFLPSGPSLDRNFDIPSASVRLAGTTSGTVTVALCVRFALSTGVQFATAVIDNAGHSSNVLTATVNRPFGAPLTPRDGAEVMN